MTDIYVTVTRHKLANVSDALCMSDGVPLRAFLRRMVVWFVELFVQHGNFKSGNDIEVRLLFARNY